LNIELYDYPFFRIYWEGKRDSKAKLSIFRGLGVGEQVEGGKRDIKGETF